MRKMILRAALFLPVFTFILAIAGKAQTVSSDEMKTFMIKEWERAKAYTVDYLNTMPADKYGYKAVDSLRSFAMQMNHLAQGNYFLMSKASDLPTPAFFQSDLEHSASALKKDSVMYYVTASYDYCIEAVKKSDVNKWGEKIKVFGFEISRLAMMLKTFEHQTHHRGQTTIYIRLQGIKPPQERLF